MKKSESYENAIVGILLRNPNAIASTDLDERWFGKWRNVVMACKQLAAEGKQIDLISIDEKLNVRGLMAQLHEVMSTGAGALENLPFYVKELQKKWRGEQAKEGLSAALAELNNEGDVDRVIGELMHKTLIASSTETKNYNVTIKQAMSSFIERLDEMYESRDKGGIGLKTGMSDIDKVLGGLHPSDMVVVGARPGAGKTAYGTTVLLNIAKTGKRIGFISSEMSAEQLMLRVASAESAIAGHKLRDASLEDSDWPRLTMAINNTIPLNIRIYDKPSITIADVMLQCKAWAIDGGVDFILIDYLTRVKPVKSLGNQNLDVGEVVTGLKNLARQLNVPVMVLAQLNRDAANRMPIMSDLRDSGIIEQEADQILMLYRDRDNPTDAKIIVEKNRHGESMVIVECYFEKETMQWLNKSSQ